MNEFIVWNKEHSCFTESFNFKMDSEGDVYYNGRIVPDHNGDNIFVAFKNIGKIDIEGNKIYADSYIVEFDVLDQILPDTFRRVKGYFSFNDDSLRYEVIDTKTKKAIYLWSGVVESNLKIIDTLQENKLGLYDAEIS